MPSRLRTTPVTDDPALHRGTGDEDFDRRRIADLIKACAAPRAFTDPDPFWMAVEARGTWCVTDRLIHVALHGITVNGPSDNAARGAWLSLAAVALEAEAA